MSRFRTEPRLGELWGGIAATVLWRFASTLPSYVRWHLGRALGLAAFALARSRRVVVQRNLELCFPQFDPDYRDRLAIECFRQFGCGILSWGFAIFASSGRIRMEVKITGKETLDSLLENNVSVILLCPHFVSAMVAMRTISEHTPMIAMYDAPINPVFNLGYKIAFERHRSPYRLINALYRGKGAHAVQMHHFKHSPKAVLKALDQAIPFFYLPDQNAKIRSQRVFAPFFGIQAATYSSLTKLAMFRNSRVLMCYPILLPKGRGYDLHLALLPEDFISGDAQQDAERMNAAIERLVKDAPEQYFWLHRRFKAHPENEPRRYPRTRKRRHRKSK